MNAYHTLRKTFLMSLCIALLMLGQPLAIPSATAHISYNDIEQSVWHYTPTASLAFCVPSTFNPQMHVLVTADGDLSFSTPTPKTPPPVFRPTVLGPPATRQIWHGPPPLRSPPFFA